MKRILGIMGSPRKNGNTHILLNTILEGAEAAGAQIDIVILRDLTINECDGCHSCWKGNECSKRDDMNGIFPKIVESDVIIFGTPVYWFGPTALMKAFVDRFVYFNYRKNRQKIKSLKAVLASPFEDETLKTAKPLVDMFKKSLKYLEVPLIKTILVPGVGEKGDILKKKDVIEKCYTFGKKIGK